MFSKLFRGGGEINNLLVTSVMEGRLPAVLKTFLLFPSPIVNCFMMGDLDTRYANCPSFRYNDMTPFNHIAKRFPPAHANSLVI